MMINLKKIKDKETKAALKTSISNPVIFSNILRAILKSEDKISQEREHFWVIGLNNRKKIRYIDLISMGNRSKTLVDPGEVFRTAITEGAASVICGHNHPSGDVLPSEDDRLLIKRIKSAGDLVGIEVLDHVIIGGQGYYSYKSAEVHDNLSATADISERAIRPLTKLPPEKDRVIIGYFSDKNNYSNRDARILTYGDISTIFYDLSNDYESLDKIETFSSGDVIVNNAQFIASDAVDACQLLSDLIKPDADFSNLVNFLGNIQAKLEDCFVLLKLLRDTPELMSKLMYKPASGNTGQPG